MNRIQPCVMLAVVFSLITPLAAAQDLSGIKCVVSGQRNANAEVAVDYRDAKVYLCCQKCADQFKADPKSFATRANHQLVLTGQFKQTACPLADGELDPQVVANVGGTKISFCCQSCIGKLTEKDDMADRAELIFGDQPFEKAFTKVQPIDLTNIKCIVNPESGVSKDVAVDYQGGKLFFCCAKCASAFGSKPREHAVAANQQLLQTGQYVQTACPISGGAASDDHAVEVAGVKVKVCCNQCVAKINSADSDAAKAKLVFGTESFAKAFKQNN